MSGLSERANELYENYKNKYGKYPRGWNHGEETMLDYEEYLLNALKEYIYVSVNYKDDDIEQRTYYYISDFDDIKENDYVLVDRNGENAVGIVKKIERFGKNDVPFPVDKTKHIIKIVDENYNKYDDYDYDEEEEIIDTYHKIFLNTMFGRLSIKRLMKLMFRASNKKYPNCKALWYCSRLNLFFYEFEGGYYSTAEYDENVFSNEIFEIIKRESIEVPIENLKELYYLKENYKKAVEFCRNNYILYHDDTDALEFSDIKKELKMYNKPSPKTEINSIDDIMRFLEKYSGTTYKVPDPSYYIENGKIIHYMGWLDYDMAIFDIPEFLEKEKLLNPEKAYNDYENNKKEWDKWTEWNVDELDNEKANYVVNRLYNAERICEGIVNDYAQSGKLLTLIKKLIDK